MVLPFYVDLEKWKPAARCGSNKFKVLFIGGDFYRKGGDVVYAMAAMDRFADVEFHIVSPNAVSSGKNVQIYRTMSADSDELIRLVQACDVMVLPTRADTSSNAAMEASACEVPVIITRCGGIAEIVLDQVTGSVLPYGDISLFSQELARYQENAELVSIRGKNARRHIEKNFSKARHMSTLRGVIATAADRFTVLTGAGHDRLGPRSGRLGRFPDDDNNHRGVKAA